MARVAQKTDFIVDVKGVGSFTFGRRTMGDELKIQVEFAKMTEGVTPTPWLEQLAGWIAALRVMTVRAPDDWDIDEMDPLDEAVYAKLFKVFMAFRQKEDSFRRGAQQAGKA